MCKKRKINVLLIHQVFVSPKEPGGTRHFEFARILEKEGVNFTIVASDVNYFTGKKIVNKNRLLTYENIEGIKVIRVFTLPFLHKSYFTRTIAFLSFMVTSIIAAMKEKNIDVIVSTSPPLFQVFPGYIISRLRKIPFVLEIRDLWVDFAVDLGVLKNPIIISIAKAIEGFFLKKADIIVVNSPGFISHIKRKGVLPNKLTLVPNGVDPSMFGKLDDGKIMKQELGLDNKFVVLYAGAHGLANDLYTLISSAEILKNYNDIVFILIGDGKEKKNLIYKVRRLGLENVIFLPSQPKTEISKFIAMADVCIAILKKIPLFTTTYPNKVFDYMAAGKPTILAIDGVIREVIEDSKGGIFVTPGDPKALANAILYYYKNPKALKFHGENARKYVIKNFNRKKQAQKFKEVLCNVLKT